MQASAWESAFGAPGIGALGVRALGIGALGIVALGIGALPAEACPDGQAAARAGVTVTFDDDTVVTYLLGEDGIVAETARFVGAGDPEGSGYGVLALHGLYVIEDFDLADGERDAQTVERTEFPGGLDALPAPEPGLRWSQTVLVHQDGEPPFERRVALDVGAPRTLAVGACSYESWPVTLRHDDALADDLMGLEFLPSLGIALFVSLADFGGAADRYVPLEIAPAAP